MMSSEPYPALTGLLSHLPAEAAGKDWTPQRRQAFLEVFEQVLDFCIPVQEKVSAKPHTKRPAASRDQAPAKPKASKPAAAPAKDDDALVERFSAWVQDNGISIDDAARKAGLTWQTCKNLLDGTSKKPRIATLEKIRSLLISVETSGPRLTFSKGNGAASPHLPKVPKPALAAAYLQRTVARWMKDKGFNHDEAASRLSIRKQTLLNVLELKLPGDRTLEILCRRIPELSQDYDSLRQGRLQQEKQ